MDRYRMVFAGFLGIFVCVLGIARAEEIAWENISRETKGVTAILLGTGNPDVIYLGTQDGNIAVSDDGGANWREVLRIKGGERRINFLCFGDKDSNSVYAATSDGLYLSSDRGIKWKKIFKGRSDADSQCTSLAVLPDAIYLGTKSGLWISKNQGNNWSKASGEIGNAEIVSIDFSYKEAREIYVVSVKGVYKIEGSEEKALKVFTGFSLNETESQAADGLEEPAKYLLRFVSVDKNIPTSVYLGTLHGIYRSKDGAKTWEKLSGYGLLSDDIDYILVSPESNLHVVTPSGIFKYENDRWHELSFGLSSLRVHCLSLDTRSRWLYAGSDKGLFRCALTKNEIKQYDLLQFYSKGEPSIKEIQDAAIQYAEVSREKISKRRRQAAKKAWLPQLSMGASRNSTDLWHWEGGSTTKTEDDILRRGKSTVDWDITLSWDLSEIIWNEDQTSIDVRSKLMVELREDILDEVTKTYFERLRVKAELDALKIEDKRKRFEKELKLEELTSLLNGMTGGYFSRNISNRYPASQGSAGFAG